MSLNVLQHKLEIMYVSLHSFIEKVSNWIAILVQIVSYFNHKYNNICFTQWTPNFVELMLELWFFFINKNDRIDFFNNQVTFQS
jgi:hypothetical protein